jgi:hypothetical protein
MASVVERFLDPLIISPTKDLGMEAAFEQSLHRDGFSAAHKPPAISTPARHK